MKIAELHLLTVYPFTLRTIKRTVSSLSLLQFVGDMEEANYVFFFSALGELHSENLKNPVTSRFCCEVAELRVKFCWHAHMHARSHTHTHTCTHTHAHVHTHIHFTVCFVIKVSLFRLKLRLTLKNFLEPHSHISAINFRIFTYFY